MIVVDTNESKLDCKSKDFIILNCDGCGVKLINYLVFDVYRFCSNECANKWFTEQLFMVIT